MSVFWTCQFQFSGWPVVEFSIADFALLAAGAEGLATESVEASAASVVAAQAKAAVTPAVCKWFFILGFTNLSRSPEGYTILFVERIVKTA